MNTMIFGPCPKTPNCVSSQNQGTKAYIEPLHYDGDRATAMRKLMNPEKERHCYETKTKQMHSAERIVVMDTGDGLGPVAKPYG
jgi:hypothetical protein